MPSKPSPPRARRVSWLDRIRSLFARPEVVQAPRVTAKGGAGRRRSSANVAHMLKALKEVLDRHETSRSVLTHLNVVEQALQHRGAAALEGIPAEVLARALSQLEMLVSDWSEAGIAALRAQLKAAMAKPGRFNTARGVAKAMKKPDAFDNSRLQVDEASVSIFMEARARWEKSLTGGR